MKPSGINIKLIETLSGNINYPFLVIDQSGNLLFFNNQADELFKPGAVPNLYDLVGGKSGAIFKALIREANNEGQTVRNIELVLASGAEHKLKAAIRRYDEDDERYFLITLQKQEIKISGEGTADLKLRTAEIKELIKNEEIIAIIEEIKALYPFTYIGKEKVRNLINRLNDIFWITDADGNFVLVNNKLAEELGLIPEAIEGKPELSFTPSYLTDFRKSIDDYIKNSLQWVSSRGFPVHGINVTGNIIRVPLLDQDSNLLAIAGLSQPDQPQESIEPDYNLILESIPSAAAFINSEGKVTEANKSFAGLMSRTPDDFLNLAYSSLLPSAISQKITLFLRESNKEASFYFNGMFSGNQKIDYLVHIKQLNRGRKELFLIIEKITPEEEPEDAINRRGIMFDLLIQNNPQPVFVYDKDTLRFLEVNEAALKLYGYRKDEFLSMDLTDLYTPEDIQTLLDSSTDKPGASTFIGPYRHKRKDGSSVYVEISKINYKFNNTDSHLNIVRDVTDKLQLLNQNQLFKAAFDNTESLLIVTDSSGFITFSNKAVQKVLGYSKKDLENTSFTALTANEVRGMVNTTIFQATPRDTIILTLDLKKADGTFKKTEVIATPVVDYKNEISSFTIVGKYEAQTGEAQPPKEIIREVVKEVIKEVPVEVIKEVIVERGVPVYSNVPDQQENLSFLSSLFHDILTPINVILGFVQELTESIQKLSPEQKESVDIINQNRENLLNIMNSIVEYSSIEKDTIELNITEIGVTEIIDSLQTEIEPVISARGIEFAYGKISSSLKFKTDKQRMLAFITLITKMISSISREKKIYFSAFNWKENEFYLSIKNNYAVSTKYLVDNFNQMFTDGEAALNKDFGIPRLNIRLAKALLRKLKGRFELIEKADSTDYGFIFPLDYNAAAELRPPSTAKPVSKSPVKEPPVKKEEKKKPESPAPFRAPELAVERGSELEDLLSEEELEMESELSALETEFAGKPEIPMPEAKKGSKLDLAHLSCLYIEDQVDSQILFKVQLKDLKDVKFAISFEEALPLLDNNRFDFIMIDINLQGEYNGIDALKIIQNMPGYKNVPLIAVTAYVLPGDRERFIATGFNDFISKPLFREKLVNSLERIFLIQE